MTFCNTIIFVIAIFIAFTSTTHGGSLSVIQAHNTFVKTIHSSKNQNELCRVIQETYSPLNLHLATGYEYYNYITNELSKIITQRLDSGTSVETVWENQYDDFRTVVNSHGMNGSNKFRKLCESQISQLFSRNGFKNFVETDKITSQDREKTILQGTLNNKKKIFYNWSKLDGKWLFNRATGISQIKYPPINEDKKSDIVEILATHSKIDAMFEKCIGIKNNIFNTNDAKLLLQQTYGNQFKNFIKVHNNDINMAKQSEVDEIIVKLHCTGNTDKGMVLSTALNEIGDNIRRITKLPLR